MVTLTISPKKGNHTRHFPHSGYLGLTPVIVTGVVETRLEEDRQPIEASRLVVRIRCYEAIGSSLLKGIRPEQQEKHYANKSWSSSSLPSYPGTSIGNNKQQFSNINVLWQTEKTLWSAASDHPSDPHDDKVNDYYASLGDWKGSWRLVVPVNAVYNHDTLPPTTNNNQNHNHLDVASNLGCAVGSTTYKGWRSWWQIETVIYHKPAGVLGTKIMKSHGLYLINYGEAQKHYSRSIEETTTSIQSITTMTNRNLRYSITAPSSVCCGDEVELIIRIASSSTHPCFNHHHQSRTIPTASSSSLNQPLLNTQHLPEPVHQSEITPKQLQVSLIRRLAIELVKTPSRKNDSSSHHIGNQFTNLASSSPSINAPLVNSSSIGSNTNVKNSKMQLTTFHTLTSNKEGISKSNVLSNLNKNQSLGHSTSSSQQLQDGYDLGFIVKLKIPIVKSKSHYSIGESFKTNSTTVNFFFQFKLSIKNKSTGQLETVELSELNVQVFSISRDQIKIALDQLSKFNHIGDNSTFNHPNQHSLNASSKLDSKNKNNDDNNDV